MSDSPKATRGAVRPEAVKAFQAAVKSALIDMLDEELTVAHLMRIARFVDAQRMALAALASPKEVLKATMRRAGGAMMLAPYGSNIYGYDSDGDVDDETGASLGTLAPAPPSETFGVSAIRELLGPLTGALKRQSAPAPGPKIDELVEAIAKAKKARLGVEVIGPLKQQLMDSLRQMTAPVLPPGISVSDVVEAKPNGKGLKKTNGSTISGASA